MQITQQAKPYKTSFDFADDQLHYAFANDVFKNGGSIAYDALEQELTYTRQRPYWWLKYMAVFFLVEGMFLALLGLHISLQNAGLIMLVFIGLSLVLYGLTFTGRRSMLAIMATDPNLVIIRDDKFTTIMDEFTARRRESVRRKFLEINPHQPLYLESLRFQGFLHDGIITENEYQAVIAKMYAMAQLPTHSLS